MKKRNIIISVILLITVIFGTIFFLKDNKNIIHNYKKENPISHEYDTLSGIVLAKNNDSITIRDNKNITYTINVDNLNVDVGSNVLLEYAGILDSSVRVQEVSIMDYSLIEDSDEELPTLYNDKGIFKDYYKLANNKLKTLSLDEKIGQLLLVEYNPYMIDDIKKYSFGGILFFSKDFRDLSKDQVKNMINNLQENAKIPLLTAVDEEGGIVVRVSSNPYLANSPFMSPSALYNYGGFERIKEDTINKSNLLFDLGLNLNLAPVVDVSTNPYDYMYSRALGQNTELTSEFASTVIEASKGLGVSYTLKHFPGYGNNVDTHTGVSFDNRSLEDIKNNDLPPFKAGINSGAEAILVSHNIVNNIDSSNPASLSPSIHNMLRDDLGFTGIIITDDISMGALDNVSNSTVKAILAGNDLIISTDYNRSVEEIKNAINDGTISENLIDNVAFRVLAWKYYKGLMLDDFK